MKYKRDKLLPRVGKGQRSALPKVEITVPRPFSVLLFKNYIRTIHLRVKGNLPYSINWPNFSNINNSLWRENMGSSMVGDKYSKNYFLKARIDIGKIKTTAKYLHWANFNSVVKGHWERCGVTMNLPLIVSQLICS